MKGLLKIYFLIFIFVIFTTYNSKNDKESVSIIFPIKEIFIENTVATNILKLKSDLSFLVNTNLFFLNKKKISLVFSNHNFISNVQLKKKYPNTLKITITEKKPVAIHIIDKKKFYITKYNEKINYIDLEIYEDLPSIFGKYKNFSTFYNDLEKNNFTII